MIKINKTKFNIFILGDSQVGKTSIIKVYQDNNFNTDEMPTIGIENHMYNLEFENTQYKFKLFDTSGREKFRNLFLSKLRLGDGIILVFSMDNKESLKHIDYWVRTIDEAVKSKKMKIILVGNKIDIGKREITNEDAVNFAKEKNLTYCEVSAKTGFLIHETINKLFKDLYESNKEEKKEEK